MPFPLLWVAGAVASAVVGAKKAWDAKKMTKNAEEIAEGAKRRHENATEKLETLRSETEQELADLGKEKLRTEAEYLLPFARTYGEIRRISYKRIVLSEGNIEIGVVAMQRIEHGGVQSQALLSGGLKGVSTGLLTSYGAAGLASTFGAASTGTAISTLSGAAATNATLAYLGGGSLAAGGAGIAGGAAVLGGLVAGPALLVMGFSAASKAEEMLTEAEAYSARVDEYIEQLSLGAARLTAINERVMEIGSVIVAVRARFLPILRQTQQLVERKVAEYHALGWFSRVVLRKNPLDLKRFTSDERKIFESCAHIGLYLYAVVKTPVLDREDKPNSDLDEILEFSPRLRDEKNPYPLLPTALLKHVERLCNPGDRVWKRQFMRMFFFAMAVAASYLAYSLWATPSSPSAPPAAEIPASIHPSVPRPMISSAAPGEEVPPTPSVNTVPSTDAKASAEAVAQSEPDAPNSEATEWSPIRYGDVVINVPAPNGLTNVFHVSRGRQFAASYNTSSLEAVAFYIPKEVHLGEDGEIDRNAVIKIPLQPASERPVSDTEFMEIQKGMKPHAIQDEALVIHETPNAFVTMKVIDSQSFAIASASVLVRQRILTIHVVSRIRSGEDKEWIIDTAKNWVDSIHANNRGR